MSSQNEDVPRTYFLHGTRRDGKTKLLAKFGSEQQLQAYVRYATLKTNEDGTLSFEQKTPLASSVGYSYTTEGTAEDYEADVPFNPTPTML